MKHELKIQSKYFTEILKGTKNFECRKNDRNFQVGDIVVLREWNSNTLYTGQKVEGKITYILDNFEGLMEGYVVFSIELIENESPYSQSVCHECHICWNYRVCEAGCFGSVKPCVHFVTDPASIRTRTEKEIENE